MPPIAKPSYSPPLRRPSQDDYGPDVRMLQHFLCGEGYALEDTCTMDAATTLSLKEWQAQHHLPASGTLTADTWAALIQHGMPILPTCHLEAYPPAPAASYTGRLREAIADLRRRFGDERSATYSNQLHKEHSFVLHRDAHASLARFCWCLFGAGLHITTSVDPLCSTHYDAMHMALRINPTENKLGHFPAQIGTPGCVYQLVPLFAEHGWSWGGHLKAPKIDGSLFFYNPPP